MTHDHDARYGELDPDFDPDLILRVLSLLRRLGSASNEWQRRQMDGGYTINQALVLHHLVSHGDATPSDLAAWMHVTRGSMTPTLKRLEDLGLITRRLDEHDGRKQWLSATPEAHDIADEVEGEALHPAVMVFHGWARERLESFCQDLEQVLGSAVFGGKA